MKNLEETIERLVDRLKATSRDSAEWRLIMRELVGLLPYEAAQPIMEDFGLFLNHRTVDPKSPPGKVLPMQRPPRRT